MTAVQHAASTEDLSIDNRSRTTAQSKSSRASKKTSARVIFTTSPHYHPYSVILLAIPILIVMLLIIYGMYQQADEFKSFAESWIMLWVLFFICGLYLFVIPRQLDVRSNGTVGIKTIMLTFQFDDICRAYTTGIEASDFYRPRFKFATDFYAPHRVVVIRKHGKWDLVVSPRAPEAFIEAIDKVVSRIERNQQKQEQQQQQQQGQEQQQQQQAKQDLTSSDYVVV